MQFLISAMPMIFAILILVPAVSNDLHAGRIPNLLCGTGFLAGLAVNFALFGVIGLGSAVAGGLLLLLLTFPFFVVGWMGAGDVKLIAAMGAIGGSPAIALTILAAIVVSGAVLALSLRVWHTVLKEFSERMTADLLAAVRTPYLKKVPIRALHSPGEPPRGFPYAVAIMAGTVAALALGMLGI